MPSERAKLERTLGHKLLTGEIPVVPPRQIHRCPVPRSHKDYESSNIRGERMKIEIEVSDTIAETLGFRMTQDEFKQWFKLFVETTFNRRSDSDAHDESYGYSI